MSSKCMYVASGAATDYTSLLQTLPNLGRDKHGWLWHEAQADTQRVDEAFLSATSLVRLKPFCLNLHSINSAPGLPRRERLNWF